MPSQMTAVSQSHEIPTSARTMQPYGRPLAHGPLPFCSGVATWNKTPGRGRGHRRTATVMANEDPPRHIRHQPETYALGLRDKGISLAPHHVSQRIRTRGPHSLPRIAKPRSWSYKLKTGCRVPQICGHAPLRSVPNHGETSQSKPSSATSGGVTSLRDRQYPKTPSPTSTIMCVRDADT